MRHPAPSNINITFTLAILIMLTGGAGHQNAVPCAACQRKLLRKCLIPSIALGETYHSHTLARKHVPTEPSRQRLPPRGFSSADKDVVRAHGRGDPDLPTNFCFSHSSTSGLHADRNKNSQARMHRSCGHFADSNSSHVFFVFLQW